QASCLRGRAHWTTPFFWSGSGPRLETMVQRQLEAPPRAVQPLRRRVVGGGVIRFVEHVVAARRQGGALVHLPSQRQIGAGIGGQLQGVGAVRIALAYVLQTAHGSPA